MTFASFINSYDKPGSIVLLEGKRNVRPADIEKLVALGTMLARHSLHIQFRSGNAPGADYYFSQGVTSVDAARLEVITPYTGHRKNENKAYQTHSLDDVNMLAEPEVIYQSKSNKRMESLVDQFVSGERNSVTIKAAYIIRDTIKVIGTQLIKPAGFAIFYDDLAQPRMGGTGHTMEVCVQNKVPYINQEIWMEWVK